MTSPHRFLPALATLTLFAVLPLGAAARQQVHATTSHHLPAGSSAGRAPIVFSFGIQGGNLRPWTVNLALDGTITASGVTTAAPKLTNPKPTLTGLLKLADAEGFFTMNNTVGCTTAGGNPDISAQTIQIRTSTVTKRVNAFGTCKSQFNELYAIFQQIAGVSRGSA